MFLTEPELTILNKYNNQNAFSTDKLEEAFRIFDEIVEGLDEYGVRELMGGNLVDLDELWYTIFEEIIGTLYGNTPMLGERLSYFDQVSDQIENVLATENLTYFILSKLPNFQMNWHHLEWGDVVQRYNRYNIIAARDHGKSYYFSNAKLAWKLWRYKPYVNKFSRKDLALSKRGFLFSFSQQQAVDLLEVLKNTIEDNDSLRERLLPRSKVEGWGKTDITCANGARLTTKGFGSSVRGAHPGYIEVDDGLKDNVIYSKTQRQKSIEYFHAVIMNMIVPGGQVGVVGTPFHANDLYGDLKSKTGWHVREYPAIFPDGTILWRERWGFEELLEKRETQGNLIFSRENLVKPVTNESTIFPMDVIERSYVGMQDVNFVQNREAYKIKFDRVVTAIDFSISSNVGADYTVMVTGGVDDKDNLYLMNVTRFKGKKFSEQMAAMRNINTNFRPDVMVLEQNVFQQIFVHQGSEEGLPVVGHTTGTNKYDLKAGLPSVALMYEMGKVKCPRGNDYDKDMGDLIASELSSITWTDKGLEGVGEHDDIAMAIWLLTIAAKKVTTGFSFRFLN